MTGSEAARTSQSSPSYEKNEPEIAANFSLAPSDSLKETQDSPAAELLACQLGKSAADDKQPVLTIQGKQLTFRQFCEEILNVDKLVVGGENDPTHGHLQTAVQSAPESFWGSAALPENKDSLECLAKRCRNWISVLLRKNAFEKTSPAIRVLDRLPLSKSLINSIGIIPTAGSLAESATSESIRKMAFELLIKFRNATGDCPANSNRGNGEHKDLPSNPPRIPKLFNDHSALNLRTHKRIREKSPPRSSKDYADSKLEYADIAEETDRKRAKSTKRVHWRPDSELVAVRLFEMDGIAKFKSSKTARQEEHDEGSAMHPNVEWVSPKVLDFFGLFGSEQFRSLISTRRGGLKEPVSEEPKTRPKTTSKTAPLGDSGSAEGPKEPPEEDQGPDPSWKPRDCGKFTPAVPPSDWLQKHNLMHSGMNMMAPQMTNPMMPSFPWAMNYPMNVGFTPAQMSEMMKFNNGMFGKR